MMGALDELAFSHSIITQDRQTERTCLAWKQWPHQLDSGTRRPILKMPETTRKAPACSNAPPATRSRSPRPPALPAWRPVLFFRRRRTDHRRPDLARRRRALARRFRHRRSRSGRAVRGDAALVRDRVLERDHRPADHALRARSGRGGHAGGRPRARRRADHRVDRDPAVHPQRAARARRPPARADAGGPRRARRRRALPCLCAERHQRGRPRRRRGRALCRADGILARAGGADLPAARRQYRLQGRQCRAISASAGARTTTSR